MARRTLASLLLVAAFAITIHLTGVANGEVECAGSADGLYADYDSGCREYVRCHSGTSVARYRCEHGRSFNTAAGVCLKRPMCVRRSCAPRESWAYASPGTGCREYYRCENGTAHDLACPSGSWFDSERQACTRRAGACYEPVCTGLPDGYHADPSQDCRRSLRCRGGELSALVPCTAEGRCPRSERCPSPRSTAVAVPAGDAHFCTDDACSTLCQLEDDGTRADRSTGCREYYTCEARHLIARGACEPGLLYSEATHSCGYAETVKCPSAVRGRCFGRADGVYRDWRDCRSWYACRRDRVVARGSCDEGFAWNGSSCVTTFYCVGPEPSVECASRPSAFYQDLDSDCARYYHCEGVLRTEFACDPGEAFDGESCVPASNYVCPSLDRDSCYGKSDGLYHAKGAGCRGHYACAAGIKSWRVCPPGLTFDEVERACVDSANVPCPADASCYGKSDGYHADESSGCRDYYYCETGERLATFTCFASRIYNGNRCVEPDEFTCGAHLRTQRCTEDDPEAIQGTRCRAYTVCSQGARAVRRCPVGLAFNGHICVPQQSYSCPGG